jgi:hypothetical protein
LLKVDNHSELGYLVTAHQGHIFQMHEGNATSNIDPAMYYYCKHALRRTKKMPRVLLTPAPNKAVNYMSQTPMVAL